MQNDLGSLLLDADLIDKTQLTKARERSVSTGLPIGRMLVLNGNLQNKILAAALKIQVRMRDAIVTREEAVKALRLLRQSEESMNIEEKQHLQSFLQPQKRRWMRLGELLVAAELINNEDVLICLEASLAKQKMIELELISAGCISADLLEAALQMQRRIEDGELDSVEAAKLLANKWLDRD